MRLLFKLTVLFSLALLPFASTAADRSSKQSPQFVLRGQNRTRLDQVGIIAGHATNVVIANQRLFVGSNDNLRIFDIRQAASPLLLGTLALPITDLRVVGSRVYATSNDTLAIIGVSNPSSPQLQSTLSLTTTVTPPSPGGRVATAVDIVGRYGYVIWREVRSDSFLIPYTELAVVDLSNPHAPAVVGRQKLVGLWGEAIQVVDSIAYVSGAEDIGGTRRFYSPALNLISVLNPTQPQQLGSYLDVCPAFVGCVSPGASGLAIDGKTVYYGVNEPGATSRGTVNVVDVTQSSKPLLRGSVSLSPADIELVDRWMVVASGAARVNVLDRSNPLTLTQVTNFDTTGVAVDTIVQNSLLYVADTENIAVLRLTPQMTVAVGPSAATISSPISSLTLDIPAGIFAQSTQLTETIDLNQSTPAFGDHYRIAPSFELTATGTLRSQPITLTLTYTDTQLGPVIESTLALYRWNGTVWQRETDSTIDTTRHTVTAHVRQFGTWALIGSTRVTYLPIVQ